MESMLTKNAASARPAWLEEIMRFGVLAAGSVAAWVCYMELWRGILMICTRELRGEATAALLGESALRGARFDLAVAARILLIFVLWALWRPAMARVERGIFNSLYATVIFICTFILAAEVEFYKEFQMRLGPLAIEYFSTNSEHNEIVLGMIWNGYPVIRWLIVCIIGSVVFYKLSKKFFAAGASGSVPVRIVLSAVWIIVTIIAHRGGIQGSPLRWGDSVFSQNAYANHMSQNGVYALMNTLWSLNEGRNETAAWARSIPEAEAIDILRKATLLPGETLVDPENYPLLRRSPATTSINLIKRPKNVVLVIMESFTARFCGALGAEFGATPNFDRLAGEGILFERAFSAGTHTAQGVFTTLCSYPNLPVYESVMKMPLGAQPFRSLPMILSELGFETIFLYNGLFSWDNKEGFFRNQGMQQFIGRYDYKNPVFVDPNWGVSDLDVFNRAVEEFNAKGERGAPFLGVILTLSNHAPFNLPKIDGLAPIEGGGDQNQRINGVHYADWALGQFMNSVKNTKWYSDTLFVFVGDHGFGVPPVLTEVNLLHMHVPMLFYGPGILGNIRERRKTTAGQLDILPTILGLVGKDTIHQSFGRNLLNLPEGDTGRAYVKPCGDPDAGWIEDDEIVVSALGRPTKLYKYNLGFPPGATAEAGADRKDRMLQLEKKLRAMISIGALTIERHKAYKSGG